MIHFVGLLTLQLLSELLNVVHDPDWIMSFGTALASHYNLYVGDNQHCALLHRCVLHDIHLKSYLRMYSCYERFRLIV